MMNYRRQLLPEFISSSAKAALTACSGLTAILNSRHPKFSAVLQRSELEQNRIIIGSVLRRVFGPKRNEITGEWRKLHNEELRDIYSLPNIVRVVKSRRMRWAGHVARMVEGRVVHRVLVGKPEEKKPLGRPRRRWIFGKWEGVETGWSWLRIGTDGGHL